MSATHAQLRNASFDTLMSQISQCASEGSALGTFDDESDQRLTDVKVPINRLGEFVSHCNDIVDIKGANGTTSLRRYGDLIKRLHVEDQAPRALTQEIVDAYSVKYGDNGLKRLYGSDWDRMISCSPGKGTCRHAAMLSEHMGAFYDTCNSLEQVYGYVKRADGPSSLYPNVECFTHGESEGCPDVDFGHCARSRANALLTRKYKIVNSKGLTPTTDPTVTFLHLVQWQEQTHDGVMAAFLDLLPDTCTIGLARPSVASYCPVPLLWNSATEEGKSQNPLLFLGTYEGRRLFPVSAFANPNATMYLYEDPSPSLLPQKTSSRRISVEPTAKDLSNIVKHVAKHHDEYKPVSGDTRLDIVIVPSPGRIRASRLSKEELEDYYDQYPEARRDLDLSVRIVHKKLKNSGDGSLTASVQKLGDRSEAEIQKLSQVFPHWARDHSCGSEKSGEVVRDV